MKNITSFFKEIIVNNINGTTGHECKCGSWIQHWNNFAGETAKVCSVVNCSAKEDLVGAHVQIEGCGQKWYIVPMCKSHNGKHGEILVVIEANATPYGKKISANISETCGK